MAKFAIIAAPFLANAVVNMLIEKGYDDKDALEYDNLTTGFVLVNTAKCSFKESASDRGRTVYNPTTQWADILAAINGTTAPAATAATTPAFTFAVGDRVTARNNRNTAAKFRLQEGYTYTVDRVKRNRKGQEIVGLAGLPNDEYLASRFSKLATTGAVASGGTAVAGSTPSNRETTTDVNGATVRVGDTVLVVDAGNRRDGKFTLIPNAILTVESITAKGALGFGGENQFLSRRFQKVTITDDAPVTGDLVVAIRDGKHVANANNISKFALPLNAGLTFRGLTVEKGNYILDGYTEHSYSPARFRTVKR